MFEAFQKKYDCNIKMLAIKLFIVESSKKQKVSELLTKNNVYGL